MSPQAIQAWTNLFESSRQNTAARPFYSDMAQAQRDQAVSKSGIVGAEAQFAPQFYSGRADEMTNRAGLTGVDLSYAPAMKKSDLDYRRAQTGLLGEQLRQMPMKSAIDASKLQNSSSRFGKAYQLSRALGALPAPARGAWISENSAAYDQMLADLANSPESQGNQLPPEAQQYFSNVSQEQRQSLIDSGIPGFGAQQLQSALPEASSLQFQATPASEEKIRTASQIAANRGLTTAATQRQMEGAIQVEELMNDPELNRKAKSASEFAGLIGRGKKSLSELSQTNPEKYEDYISFKNQDMTLILNRIKTLDAMGATNEQRKELNGLYDKTMDSLTSNPKQFMIQFKNLKDSTNRVAKAVEKSANVLDYPSRLAEPQSSTLSSAATKTYNPDSDSWE